MADPTPIAVSAHGFSWTAAGAWATALTVAGTVVTMIIKQIGPWRKQRDDAEDKMRSDLISRVEKLEKMLEAERARHDAERALDRHRINNMDQALNYLFLMFETQPERAKEAISAVKEMRQRQMEAEALEKAAIHAATIKKAEGDE